ncbi:MAG: protein BatD, partial [Barnesiella sp.]|nr:protein BatD [Barnesiella sp.]
ATVPSMTVNVDGKKYSSQATVINVLASSASVPQPASPSSRPVSIDDPTTQTTDRSVKGNDVFIRIITSPNTCYEQEAIECVIKLYTKYNISEFMPITQPAFNGFTVEDLPIQSSLNEMENVNGQQYATAVVKKCILFPQKSGSLTINSGTYDLTVVQYDQINLGFYSAYQPQTKKIRVNSNSATLNVQPLPSPQPAGFNGVVGQFKVNVGLSSNSFRTNEPVTLNYTISGSGNIRYIKDVEIDFPSEFEQYSPQHNVDAKVNGNNVTGTSVTELTFVPKETGKFTIKVPEFVYFDPVKKEYVTIEGKQFELNVSKGISGAPADRKDIASKNVDILYIRPISDNLNHNHDFIISSVWYWGLILLLTCGGTGYIIYFNSRRKRSADVTGLKKSKANRVARKRLKLAEKYMSQNNREKFYEEILRAMWGYFSDKLSIPVADLSRSSIENQLQLKNVDQNVNSEIIALLDSCEMARYTPSGGSSELTSVYDRACSVINSLEKQKIS